MRMAPRTALAAALALLAACSGEQPLAAPEAPALLAATAAGGEIAVAASGDIDPMGASISFAGREFRGEGYVSGSTTLAFDIAGTQALAAVFGTAAAASLSYTGSESGGVLTIGATAFASFAERTEYNTVSVRGNGTLAYMEWYWGSVGDWGWTHRYSLRTDHQSRELFGGVGTGGTGSWHWTLALDEWQRNSLHLTLQAIVARGTQARLEFGSTSGRALFGVVEMGGTSGQLSQWIVAPADLDFAAAGTVRRQR